MFNAEFAHFINVLIGVDTPFQRFCIENKINNHRKLRPRWKDLDALEYTDSSGTKAKLSKDDIEEFAAIYPFKNHLQNELGLKTKNPVDITQYSRKDFLRYYDNEFDPNNPTKYDQALAQGAEKHNEEMKKIRINTGGDKDHVYLYRGLRSYAPSHTSGLSQSSMTTKNLEIASMNDGENGEVLDDWNGFDWNDFMKMPNTTKYTALKKSWGGQLSQQCNDHHSSWEITNITNKNLYGLRNDRIDCSSNRLDIGINTYMESEGDINCEGLLRVKWGCAVGNIQRMWRGWYVRKLIKSKSADNDLIVPDTVSIEDSMPISGGDNVGDTTSVMVSEESDVLSEARINFESWGGQLSQQSYTHHDKSDPNNKIEEEWGSLFDCPVCYDDIQDGAVKDWQWIDLMTRKFASRGKFANRGAMLYELLLIMMSCISSTLKVITMKSLILSCGTIGTHCFIAICGLKEIPSHAHRWGDNTIRICHETAVELSLKLKESSCRDSSKTDCNPSHTSGISQSSSSSLTSAVDTLPIDLDGEAMDDSNGFLERPQDTTRAALKDSAPKDDTSWGAWGEYSDNPDDVKDWEHIMLEVRKFAGRAFVFVEIKLNHQLEKTPWTRGEEESNSKGALNDTRVNSSGVIGDMSKGAPENTSRLTLISIPRGIILSRFLAGILGYVDLHGPRIIPSHTHRWGAKNGSMFCPTDSANQMVRRGAVDNDNSDAILRFFGKDTTLSYSLKLIQWSSWWNNGNSKALEESVYSCWIGLLLSYADFHTKSGLDEDILTYQLKAYAAIICNSLVKCDVVLLYDHDGSIVNRLNLSSEDHIKLIGTSSDNENYTSTKPTVIACIDKNILTLAGDLNLRYEEVMLTKHNTLDTQQNNYMRTGSIIPCSRDIPIEVDIVSGTSIGIRLASCIESNDSDENKENSLQLRIGLPSMDITSHNATNATSSPHATIMHCSRQATSVSIIPIMDVANKVNDSIYQDGEHMPNELLRSSRLTSSYGSRSDNDTRIDWYSDNVYDTYIQIVLVATLVISKVLDSENINTTYAALLWNRNWKGKYNQHQRTQTPFAWYSKKQTTAETATYGSEVFLVRQHWRFG